jgi:hypothetical protein
MVLLFICRDGELSGRRRDGAGRLGLRGTARDGQGTAMGTATGTATGAVTGTVTGTAWDGAGRHGTARDGAGRLLYYIIFQFLFFLFELFK